MAKPRNIIRTIKHCDYCGKEFEGTVIQKFCCNQHKILHRNHNLFPEGTDYVECKICSFRGHDLYHHLRKCHKEISQEEYLEKFNLKFDDLASKTSHEKKSNGQKLAIQEGRHLCFTSENNPSKSQECKDGRNSPFSFNFRGYDGLSQEEKEAKVNEMYNNAIKTKQDNCNDNTKIEYYIKRGYSISDAKKQLKERQQTFSLEKCIEKYGPEAGYQRWKERQEKWQKTLDNLPEEEKKRILMEKAAAIKNVAGYSTISQELFNSLYEHIKNDYQKIYYATLENNKMAFSKTNSYEYVVKCKDRIHCFFLDFYVKDINKVIEFDGDYWHGIRPGNQERDRLREEKLNEMGFDKIYHVKERDYRKNPEKVIAECLAFLKGQSCQ